MRRVREVIRVGQRQPLLRRWQVARWSSMRGCARAFGPRPCSDPRGAAALPLSDGSGSSGNSTSVSNADLEQERADHHK